ncbi:MAG TPA: PfkB family carbohydrate kinase, partial [Bryobacteraceae bacterium]
MIITLTINPSVDRNVFVDRLVFEDRAYILSRSDSAGGRGINASRVIHSFGSKTLAVVTSGGPNGEQLEKLLGKAGFPVKVVAIKNEIRNNFTITDRQGLAVKLNERGPAISPEELASVEKTIESRLEGASWLMLCGSIPPDVSPDFYTKLIRMAREKRVKTLL